MKFVLPDIDQPQQDLAVDKPLSGEFERRDWSLPRYDLESIFAACSVGNRCVLAACYPALVESHNEFITDSLELTRFGGPC